MIKRGHPATSVVALGWLALAAACAHATRATPPDVAASTADWSDSVAVGYGVLPRKQVTGSVGSVAFARDAERPRVTRVEELLEGRVAGVDVWRVSGGDYAVRVRGAGGGVAGEPLWVINGTPAPQGLSPRAVLSGIHPGDVARIDVLKGSAAAIYGMRGHNGVILVTLRSARR